MIRLLVARYGPNSPAEPELLLPPGFAEGRSSAYIRVASGLVIVDENGELKDMAAILREDPSEKTSAGRLDQRARSSDVIDLNWLETRPLELREVELQLRELAGKVVADTAVRFSAYEGPRYRSALRMHLGECANPVATGGVLQPWPGMVEGTSAIHVRMYLEVWASVMSGGQVEFRSFPPFSPDSLNDPDTRGGVARSEGHEERAE